MCRESLVPLLWSMGGGLSPSPAHGPSWARSLRLASLRATARDSLCSSRFLSMGWDTVNIGVELGLSPHTVRNHSTNLRRKLDVRSSLEAVMASVRMGVLTFDNERREASGS